MKPKRDLETLQQIEESIRKKFGEQALVDPRSSWNESKEKDFKNQLLDEQEKYLLSEKNEEKVEENGFLISKRLLTVSRNGEGCATCGKFFLNASDNIYLLKFECCQNCYVLHIEGREERWESGWRPKPNN